LTNSKNQQNPSRSSRTVLLANKKFLMNTRKTYKKNHKRKLSVLKNDKNKFEKSEKNTKHVKKKSEKNKNILEKKQMHYYEKKVALIFVLNMNNNMKPK